MPGAANMSNARSIAAGLVLWQISRAYAREVYMPNFRLYLLDENDNIKAFEIVECPADAEAVSAAEKLLAKYWNFRSVEIWQGPRMIRRIDSPRWP
jgi:hypothetical protein